jgi:hypothetical protein
MKDRGKKLQKKAVHTTSRFNLIREIKQNINSVIDQINDLIRQTNNFPEINQRLLSYNGILQGYLASLYKSNDELLSNIDDSVNSISNEIRGIPNEIENERKAADEAERETKRRKTNQQMESLKAAQRKAEELRIQINLDSREIDRQQQLQRVQRREQRNNSEKLGVEQELNIINSLIRLGAAIKVRNQFINFEHAQRMSGNENFIKFSDEIRYKINNSGLGVDLKPNFINWSNEGSQRRCTHCYICGYRLQRTTRTDHTELNTQNDHVIEYFISAGLMGHGSRAVIRPVHRICNSPIKANPEQRNRIPGASTFSGLLGWGVLRPPFITYTARITMWSLNRRAAEHLRITARERISNLGEPFHFLQNESTQTPLRDDTGIDLKSVIDDLNKPDYGAGEGDPRQLRILKNPDFIRTFIDPGQHNELISKLDVWRIDKFLYGLVVTACMHLDGTLNDIFNDRDFREAVRNVLGPFHRDQGSTRSGPSSEPGPGYGFGKQKNNLKRLKRLHMDLRYLMKI